MLTSFLCINVVVGDGGGGGGGVGGFVVFFVFCLFVCFCCFVFAMLNQQRFHL